MKRTLACVLPFLLAACGSGDTDDLRLWMQTSTQGLRGQIEPLPQAQSYQPFAYQAFNLLDPFNAQKLAAAKNQNQANAPDMKRPREALENYDLDKLAVVGVIRRSGTNYGLVRTPEGAVYRVQAGNFVGPNFGRIKKIGDTEIELTETVEDLNGEWVQRNTSLYLDEQGQNK